MGQWTPETGSKTETETETEAEMRRRGVGKCLQVPVARQMALFPKILPSADVPHDERAPEITAK